jgi:uncharacterized membrane protein YfcA
VTPEPERFIQAVFIGFFVGVLSGGLGVGGGILATPLMRMLLAVDPHTAIGTSLAMIVPTAVSGALSYLRKRMVAVKLAVKLAVPAVVGTIAGSISTLFFHGGALMLLIALLLAATGLDLLFGLGKRLKSRTDQACDSETALVEGSDPYPWGKVVLVGLVCGYLSGLLGVGGGFLLVPALIYIFKSPIKAAFGTSLAIVALVCIPGTLVHVAEGHVYHWLAFSLVLGSVPGAWLGSMISMRLKDNWLRISFGVFVIAVAGLFAFKEIQEILGAGG